MSKHALRFYNVILRLNNNSDDKTSTAGDIHAWLLGLSGEGPLTRLKQLRRHSVVSTLSNELNRPTNRTIKQMANNHVKLNLVISNKNKMNDIEELLILLKPFIVSGHLFYETGLSPTGQIMLDKGLTVSDPGIYLQPLGGINLERLINASVDELEIRTYDPEDPLKYLMEFEL